MFEKLLIDISNAFKAENINYMVIGGQAVLVFGEARFTKDIDIIIGGDLSQLNKVKNICSKLNLRLADTFDDEKIKQTLIYPAIDDITGLRVDIIFSFSKFERHALGRAIGVDIGGTEVKYSTIEDLIIFKIFAGRPIDLEDVKNIILKNPRFDEQYITEWLEKFDEGSEINYTQVFNNIVQNL